MVDQLSGHIVFVGKIKKSLQAKIDLNHKIVSIDLINSEDVKSKEKGKQYIFNIKKLSKEYKNKKVDYVIIDYKSVKEYMKYIIKDSLMIAQNKVYIINHDVALKKKYKRYKSENKKEYIEIKKQKRIIVIDYFYLIIDTVDEWLKIVGDLLTM